MAEQDGGLAGPPVNPAFAKVLDDLVAVAERGHEPGSTFFNPPDDWLVQHMRVFQELPPAERTEVIEEGERIHQEAEESNAQGKAAYRAGSESVPRLDTGGLAFYSQLGVARRPDLTQYFIDGFPKNRDGIAFSEASQALFAEVLPYLVRYLAGAFDAGEAVVQSDRQVCDVPGRSFHVRHAVYAAPVHVAAAHLRDAPTGAGRAA